MDYLEMINYAVTIPEDYKIAEEDDQVRNGVMVHIVRLQPAGEFVINGPRIIGIFENDALVSLKDLSEVPSGALLDEDVAVEKGIITPKKVFILLPALKYSIRLIYALFRWFLPGF